MKAFFFFFFAVFTVPLFGSSDNIHNYLLLRDVASAVKEADQLNLQSGSFDDVKLVLRAYAAANMDEKWFSVFDRFSDSIDVFLIRDVLEDFCRSVLERSFTHSSTLVRTIGVLASGMAGDVRVSSLLETSMEDDSDLVRYLSVNTVPHYPSTVLKAKLARICRNDPSSFVRASAYAVAARLNMVETADVMIRALNDKLRDESERKTAGKSLALLERNSGNVGIRKLSSPRDAGLLSCEIIRLNRAEDSADILAVLLKNGCVDVKIEALKTAMDLGSRYLVHSEKLCNEVKSILKTAYSPEVVVYATALNLLIGNTSSYSSLKNYLLSSDVVYSRTVAGLTSALGFQGLRLARECFPYVSDLKTQTDLALTLLLYRENIEVAGDTVKRWLSLQSHDVKTPGSERSFLCEDDACTMNCRSVDLNRFIGLKFINLLMICHYSKTYDVFVDFWSGKKPSGFGFFSRVFWEEEEDDLQNFLEKTSDHLPMSVKLEAILSSLSHRRDEAIFAEAEKFYREGGWNEKIAVLEAFAINGDKQNIPFLLGCCRESVPSLKTAAAGALFMVLKK